MAGVLQHERLDKPLPCARWGDRADNTEVLPPLDPTPQWLPPRDKPVSAGNPCDRAA